MDERTRKLITIHKAFYLSDNIDRLYLSRKAGVESVDRIEDCIDASIQEHKDYIKKRKIQLIIPTSNSILH